MSLIVVWRGGYRVADYVADSGLADRSSYCQTPVRVLSVRKRYAVFASSSFLPPELHTHGQA
jgi:hypothetical protein